MNRGLLVLSLAGLIPCALAETPEPTASTTVSCENSHWPTSSQVTRYLQVPSVTVGRIDGRMEDNRNTHSLHSPAGVTEEAERMTLSLRREGRHLCWLGASRVRVDFFAEPDHRAAMLMHPLGTT